MFFVLIYYNGHSRKERVLSFCQEQCLWNEQTDTWSLDLEWMFDEHGVNSTMNTKKQFSLPINTHSNCINYCGELITDLNQILFPEDHQRYDPND